MTESFEDPEFLFPEFHTRLKVQEQAEETADANVNLATTDHTST